jgi:hypothetical protein
LNFWLFSLEVLKFKPLWFHYGMDHQSACMADEVSIFIVKNQVPSMLRGQGQPSKWRYAGACKRCADLNIEIIVNFILLVWRIRKRTLAISHIKIASFVYANFWKAKMNICGIKAKIQLKQNTGGMCWQPKLTDCEYMWDKGQDF